MGGIERFRSPPEAVRTSMAAPPALVSARPASMLAGSPQAS